MNRNHHGHEFLFGRPPNSTGSGGELENLPDWQQSDPKWIKGALRQALMISGGGWHVIDSVRAIDEKPRLYIIANQELVVWRGTDRLLVAPNACPHLGASLADGYVREGCLVCPWHGLVLDESGHSGWRVLPSHDDGLLLWVRLDGKENPSKKPRLCVRPTRGIESTIRMEAACDPEDVIANRLDPWHGSHFHPHSFGRLRVIEKTVDSIVVRVTYRITHRMGVEVDARFDCPDPRTIVMTIIDGEGIGSVVETHATPVSAGRCVIIEATVATSDRFGFRLASRAAGLVRRSMARRARRLWVEDAAYAERRYALRKSRA